jgi:preprotein translocase subunit SecG
MVVLLTVLHVIFCLFLILVILLQTGKGAGMGVAFGGASQTVFGPRGAGSFIGKATGIVAALFMVTSLVLAYFSSSKSTGIAEKAEALAERHSGQVEEVDLSEAAAESTQDVEGESPEPEPEPEPTPAEGDAGSDAAGDAGAASTPATDGGASSEGAAAPSVETGDEPEPDTPSGEDAGSDTP